MPTPTEIFEKTAAAPSKTEDFTFYTTVATEVCESLKAEIDNGVEVDDAWHNKVDTYLQYVLDYYPDEAVPPAVRMALTTYQLPLDASKLKSFESHDGRLSRVVMASMQARQSQD